MKLKTGNGRRENRQEKEKQRDRIRELCRDCV